MLDSNTWNFYCMQTNKLTLFKNKVTYKLIVYKLHIKTEFGIK